MYRGFRYFLKPILSRVWKAYPRFSFSIWGGKLATYLPVIYDTKEGKDKTIQKNFRRKILWNY